MSKKTIITILGVLVSIISFLPIYEVVSKLILFILGVLIVFFTKAKITPNKITNEKTHQPRKV
jgi:hypothetical protein